MKLADQIRDHVQRRYANTARQRSMESFTVVAGEVHSDMKLANRMPAVCGALRSKALQSGCGVALVEWSGPDQGSTAAATFKFVDVPEHADAGSDDPVESPVAPAQPITERPSNVEWQRFQNLAREHMERHFGQPLAERELPAVPKRFDMVSSDGAIVGDAKYLSLVGGKRTPRAKFMEIAAHIWLLEKTSAQRIFLVFGNQREVVVAWLKKYGRIAGRVELYFLSEAGALDRLH